MTAMWFKDLLLILYAIEIPYAAYQLGKLKRGEKVERDRSFFVFDIGVAFMLLAGVWVLV